MDLLKLTFITYVYNLIVYKQKRKGKHVTILENNMKMKILILAFYFVRIINRCTKYNFISHSKIHQIKRTKYSTYEISIFSLQKLFLVLIGKKQYSLIGCYMHLKNIDWWQMSYWMLIEKVLGRNTSINFPIFLDSISILGKYKVSFSKAEIIERKFLTS